MSSKEIKVNLDSIRVEIQKTQLVLIFLVTVLLSTGGLFINLKSNEKALNEDLQNISKLITRLYNFTQDFSQVELCFYMDDVVKDLSAVDVISIVNKDNIRIYHTKHELINTQFDGTHPDFAGQKTFYKTEDSTGPSGPQRRTYAAIYDKDGNYCGFIMTIRLLRSIHNVTTKTACLFLIVFFAAILIEIAICATFSTKVKRKFIEFTEDFEGTKFLVDSMRANNHDFTNKLHVILGLIQIGEYKKAESYIQNISIIQRQTVSAVMNSIDNPSIAALVIGKIARASECNVRFILNDGIRFNTSDISIPSEALVTIIGNLIDNAIDAMNVSTKETKELRFGIYTTSGEMLATIQDTGDGIPKEIGDMIFDNGFSTKGSGRGVGLHHTKQLIESLGGEISFESQVGKGTCFTVKLGKRKSSRE